jgi:hypothetical protein
MSGRHVDVPEKTAPFGGRRSGPSLDAYKPNNSAR